ncbi:MAG: ribosome biogenesis GTP-binding protein YihA/YsxC [Prevotellaceae bacterium]|jgi:GTP-binding protein|nr:ribosome biogenesis GTP-binding protein YihA/YsxC [Prevotellaceae bacterium]
MTATFIKSSPSLEQCPAHSLPEYAFIGRSNVGKSSLINMLTNNAKLSKVSSKPGKTKLINHFLVDEAWYLVDLPGYGFAKQSKSERERFAKMISYYVRKREQLTLLFVLLDIRLEPQQIDLEFIQMLGENGVPFALVFTKADKISATEQRANTDRYRRTLLQTWEELPEIFITSSEKRAGGEEILKYITSTNDQLPATN